MRKITLKIGIGILAFAIGIIATAVWFIAPFSLNQILEVAPLANIENEMTEEYAVYSAVLNDLFVKDKDSVKLLTISPYAVNFGDFENLVNH